MKRKTTDRGLPFILILSIIVFSQALFALDASAQGDTVRGMQLSEQAFLDIVRSYHPLVRQAGLMVERSDAAVTSTRINFDPTLAANFDRKRFAGELYYSYFNPELTIPTWYGIEIYAGWEEIYGDRVNSESTLGQSSYVGLSVPVLKDLVLDKRRAQLQQAKIYRSQTEAERLNVVNDLLFSCIEAYWNWVREYRVYQLLTEAVQINRERLRFVKIEYQQGNRPAIDTVEALAQLQQFELMQNDALLGFRNSTLALSNFLWLENDQPYNLPVTVIPDTSLLGSLGSVSMPVIDDLLLEARMMHPKLQVYKYKIDWLAIDQKLKWQGLLPKLDLKANLLNKGYNVFSKVDGAFLQNNYKFGVDFSLPLRLSEGRGQYREARLKLAETNLEQKRVQWEIENKVKSYYNQVMALRQQASISENALQNYQRLLRGEDIRFRAGESTLFVLNSRENKVIETAQKLAELQTKLFKSLAGVRWAAGQLK